MSQDVQELPPLGVTPEEKELAQMVPSTIARPYVEKLLCRERQFSAALTEIKELRERAEDDRLAFVHANEVVGKYMKDAEAKDTELAAKDEKIAELEAMADTSEWYTRAIAAESKLRAVSDVLKQDYDKGYIAHNLYARLRSIVENT